MAEIEILKYHCGSVELELTLPNRFENLRKCNCSICCKRNAVVASVSINNLKAMKGETELRGYTFNTHTVKHYLCSICDIYTTIKGVQYHQNMVSILPVLKV